ncbi:RCC1 domain-containing protein [Spirosoma knui]
MSRLLPFLLLCILTVLSCKKDTEQPNPTPAGNLITANPTVTGVSGASVSVSGSTYTLTVPAGTNVKVLKISIPVASGSRVDPDPSIARDYTNPVSYTITAADGGQQTIRVTVVVEQAPKSSEKQITAFSFATLNPVVQASIDQTTHKITATVPASTDITKLVPTLTVSSKATVSPASGVAQNFTNPVSYTVTAEDGSKQAYEVKVEKSSVSSTEILEISVGANHSLILRSDNTLWVNGINIKGQLGDGTNVSKFKPTKVMSDVKAIAAGESYSFIIKTDNSLWATGFNNYGQLGDNGRRETQFSYIKVMSDVKAVATKSWHSLIIKTDNSLWAVGYNFFGQLGKDVDGASFVKIMDDVKEISAGGSYSLIIKTDNSLWAAGSNYDGQLGDPTHPKDKATYSFVKVMDNVKAMSAGIDHNFFLKTDNTLWGAGSNSYGKMGDGTNFRSYSPVKIMDNVKAMSAGYDHSFVIKTDNSLWGAGRSNTGQLGDGTIEVFKTKNIFFQITTDVKAVAAGKEHSLIVKTDNSLWAAGINDSGELGDNTTVLKPSFVKINFP